MSKEVQMTFRVEPALRAEFSEAAAQADRPAAQLLREFMRAYINESLRGKTASTAEATAPQLAGAFRVAEFEQEVATHQK